jgi:hypothetical protein
MRSPGSTSYWVAPAVDAAQPLHPRADAGVALAHVDAAFVHWIEEVARQREVGDRRRIADQPVARR